MSPTQGAGLGAFAHRSISLKGENGLRGHSVFSEISSPRFTAYHRRPEHRQMREQVVTGESFHAAMPAEPGAQNVLAVWGQSTGCRLSPLGPGQRRVGPGGAARAPTPSPVALSSPASWAPSVATERREACSAGGQTLRRDPGRLGAPSAAKAAWPGLGARLCLRPDGRGTRPSSRRPRTRASLPPPREQGSGQQP